MGANPRLVGANLTHRLDVIMREIAREGVGSRDVLTGLYQARWSTLIALRSTVGHAPSMDDEQTASDGLESIASLRVRPESSGGISMTCSVAGDRYS